MRLNELAWIAYIVGGIITASLLVIALGVLWKKVIYPAAQGISLLGQMLPVLRDFTEAFKDNPNVFLVLNTIAAQFRTDSGSSLRDIVNGLAVSAAEQKAATETLRVVAKAAEQLSAEDRLQRERLILRIDRLNAKVEAGAATGLRIEEAAADAHARADAVDSSAGPGTAADAAAVSKPPDEVG